MPSLPHLDRSLLEVAALVAIAACALVAAAGSAAVALTVHRPVPRVHDEYSYLLQADTLAHGRLANAPHPCWRHFETFHVVAHPTYVSKYPPGHGLAMAAGQVLGGDPLVGVWLEAAFCVGAVAWMLFGWLPFRWASMGSLVVLVRFGIASYWTQSYWGGSLAAGAGALVYGALPRLRTQHRARDLWLFCAGLWLLASTRPFEGFVASAPAVFLVLRAASSRARVDGVVREARRLAPLALCALAVAAWTLAYDRATTGDPWTMPYWLHDRIYAVAPPFLWLPLATEPLYHHAVMREYWTGWAADAYRVCATPSGFASATLEKLGELWKFYAGPLWSAAVLGAAAIFRSPACRLALGVCIASVAAMLASTYTLAHYAAPLLGLLALLAMTCLRSMARVRCFGRPVGAAFVCSMLAATLAALAFQVRARRADPNAWEEERARVVRELSASAEADLVLVRYGAGHSTHDEWVYNGADIDAAPVVWARDMGADANRALLEHFLSRRVWTCEVDARGRPTLAQYAP